jgi:hypothetical protein
VLLVARQLAEVPRSRIEHSRALVVRPEGTSLLDVLLLLSFRQHLELQILPVFICNFGVLLDLMFHTSLISKFVVRLVEKQDVQELTEQLWVLAVFLEDLAQTEH